MTSGYFLIFFQLISALHAAPKETLPPFIKVCHKSDPQLNECVKASVEEIRPHLKFGIKELHVPPCEPLIIPEVVVNQGSGSVSVKSTYSNIKIYGATDFVLKSVNVDLAKNRAKINVFIPQIFMTGNYSIAGKIIMLPISGTGVSRGNYSNIDATTVIKMEKVRKDGVIYLNVADLDIDLKVGDAHLHLTNLFNGEKQLGDAMNAFLNENWSNLAKEMQPVVQTTIGNIFKKFANKIFRSYPADVLLPP